jgi:hypothetical protein
LECQQAFAIEGSSETDYVFLQAQEVAHRSEWALLLWNVYQKQLYSDHFQQQLELQWTLQVLHPPLLRQKIPQSFSSSTLMRLKITEIRLLKEKSEIWLKPFG